MITEIKQKLSNQLHNNASISYEEICDILDAFQIASGQSFAIGKTKALLDFLKEGKSFVIENFDYLGKNKEVSTTLELVNIYKNIDQLIDLSNEQDFKEYFS